MGDERPDVKRRATGEREASGELPIDAAPAATPRGDKASIPRPNKLLWHMYVSYFWLRSGMGALAFLLPIVVVGGYALVHATTTPLGSLSAYYNAGPFGLFFTGSLFAVGMGLLIYHGFTLEEEIALDVAGVCAFIVALVPHDNDFMEIPFNGDAINALHLAAAVLLFFLLAYVAVFRSGDTLAGYTAARRARFVFWYKVTGWAMVLGILTTLGLGYFGFRPYVILATEVVGIWAFAAFWAMKSYELRLRTERDMRLLERA